MEETFRQLDGVTSTLVGYTGGNAKSPTYYQVCGGNTGHAEAVQVQFDSERISYEKLLEVFWNCHSPGRAGDEDGQYRSAIFFHTPEQEKAAHASKARRERANGKQIYTYIVPAQQFWAAEEYHQRYYEKMRGPKARA